MTAAARDPVTLAREVLGDELAWAALDSGHHPEGQAAVYRLANAAPTLARAALRVSALADLLDAEADRVGSRGGAFTARAFATEIRTALNGENRG